MSSEAIAARIKFAGEVDLEEGAALPTTTVKQVLGPDAGEKRYKASCSLCHEANIAKSMGSPRFRHKEDWAPRLEQGMDGLLASAIKGKGAMPPRGTCMQCSDEELRLAIEYMLPR